MDGLHTVFHDKTFYIKNNYSKNKILQFKVFRSTHFNMVNIGLGKTRKLAFPDPGNCTAP